MDTSTRAAPAADLQPLYVTAEERETITAGLRAAALLMEHLSADARQAAMPAYAELLEHSSDDYATLARRLRRGELDRVPS